jgi:hypothetical protein
VADDAEWRLGLGERFREKYGEIRMARELLRCHLIFVR